ncbi:MAG: hypothetical protein QG657_5654, partial [Acidobacteriota bacterium]|nr:hypothetical protein [Acidobacteriota bacterium]
IEKGVLADNIVGIMMERSIDLIIGIVGILKAGCAYEPINPRNPVERIDFILKDSNAKIIVGNRHACSEELNCQLSIVKCELLMSAPRAPFHHSSFIIHNSNHLAYIIYTSGSTGNPKGVPITHANLCPLLHWGYKHLGIGPKDRAMQNLSYYFDWSVWEIFITLTTGAVLYIVSDELALDRQDSILFIKENDITVLHVTPTQYLHFIGGGHKLDTLKYLFLGAEKLTVDLLKRSFASVQQDCRVFNMYGPTEATIISAVLEIKRGDENRFEALTGVPIGGPVANGPLLVLDNYFNLCPVNITGELYIVGDGVAAGYLNNPELTCEKFKTCPQITQINTDFSSPLTTHHSPIYKTGDLGRWLDDGNIEFIGRIDQQVKIRGFRVELGEIENLIIKHDRIKDTVVEVKEDETGDKYLVAYFVSDIELSDTELREYLLKGLPDYLIPSYFVRLKNIPLNCNGKVDRKALPSPVIKVSGGYVAPRDEIEKRLVKIWSKVLNLKEDIIGIDDSFFRLGGHSLKATMLIAKISKELNVQLPLEKLFKNPQIRKIADIIRQSPNVEFLAIEPMEKKQFYPLSSAQSRMYVIQQMQLDSIAYNMSLILELEGQVELEKLNSAFNALIKQHESLRTYFVVVKGKPVQRLLDEVNFNVEYYDTSREIPNEAHGTPREETHSAPYTLCYADIRRETVRPFDLSHAPLLRISLLKTPGARQFLVIDMHHIICDGVSYGILVKDFKSLYEGKELTSLKIQYKDFAVWQNKRSASGEIKKQEEYWLKLYEGDIPQLELPTDFERPRAPNFAGEEVSFKLSREETSALNRLALDEEVTLYMLLLALYNIFLAKLCNREDILVGTSTAGRRHTDLETVCGMFVNTLCLRNYPEGGRTFGEFLHDVKQRTVEAFENQDYPFEDLVEKLPLKRIPGRHPLFNASFSFHNEMESDDIAEIDIPGLKLKPYKTETTTSYFDITLRGTEINQELFFSFHYSTALFEKESIEMFTRYFKKIISPVIQDSRQRIGEIKILPDGHSEFLGRIDRQVKTKGFGVEPKEIEKTPSTHPPIAETMVTKREELNGIERALVKIWSEVLEIDEASIGVDDFFTDLNGQSLKAIMMSSWIHKKFNVSIPIHVIFELSNIKRLAEYIKKAVEDRHLTIEPAEKKEYYELSPGQKRLYILMRMEEESIGYNVPQIFTLEGKIDIEKLEDAFNRLIKRHESLRTSFKMVGEEPVQGIHKIVDFKLEYYYPGDGRGVSHALVETGVIIKNFIRPFKLEEAPLLRAQLMEIGEKKYILMVDMHHIISDAASRRIFKEDFLDLYEGKLLPDLRLQYKDYSEWVNSPAQREVMKRQETYWLEQFEGELPVLDLPTDYPRPAVQGFEGGRVLLSIGKEATTALQKLAMYENATMFMILLAAFNIFLAKISGQEDIIVGSPVVGRRHTDLHRIMGIFVNTLALRNYPRGEKTFTGFLNELRTGAFNAFENQHYQFEDLVERVSVKRDVSRNPLFDVMFSYQEIEGNLQDIPREDFSISDRETLQYESMIAKFDLLLGAMAGEELYLGIEYCTKLFKKETCERFLASFKKILQHIMAEPGVRLSEIEIISLEEKNRVLYDFNNTAAEYPANKTIHQLFEEQVEQNPDRIALVGATAVETLRATSLQIQITYRQLNEQSDRLAGLLIEKGVLADNIVGIMMERSIEMVIGIFGILEAGGAYMPIDPDYPQERINYMLRDSGAQLLINEKFFGGGRGAILQKSPPVDANLAYIIYTSGSTGNPKGVI